MTVQEIKDYLKSKGIHQDPKKDEETRVKREKWYKRQEKLLKAGKTDKIPIHKKFRLEDEEIAEKKRLAEEADKKTDEENKEEEKKEGENNEEQKEEEKKEGETIIQ